MDQENRVFLMSESRGCDVSVAGPVWRRNEKGLKSDDENSFNFETAANGKALFF